MGLSGTRTGLSRLQPQHTHTHTGRFVGEEAVSMCMYVIDIYVYIYIFMVPPPQRPRFSYINIQSGRWGSQSEIDGMGLRVGGFRV